MDLLVLLGMLVTLYLLSVVFDPQMHSPLKSKIGAFLLMVAIIDVWVVGLAMTYTSWLAISTSGFFLGIGIAALPISLVLFFILKYAYMK